ALHYGWWVAVTAGLVFFVQGGVGSYAFGVLLPEWVREFGWTRAAISGVYAIATLLPGVAAPIVGRWTDQYGPRTVIITGAMLMGGAYMALALVEDFAVFAALMTLGAIGRCGLSQAPVSAAVAQWFATRRGLAMGIASSGISVAGVVMTPMIAWLVIVVGWRATVVALGLFIWVIVAPAVWRVMRGAPAALGQRPYGAGATPTTVGAAVAPEVTVSEAVRLPTFWLVAVALTIGTFGMNSIGLHTLPALIDKGVSAPEAAAMVSLLAGLSIVGKIVFGALGDRFGATNLLAITLLAQAVGYGAIGVIGAGVALWAFPVVMGLSIGGTLALQPTMVAERFGVRAFGAIFGLTLLPSALSAAASPLFAGVVRDVATAYLPAYVTFAVTATIGSLALWATLIRRPAAQ
ncbi:MAG: MFS transporter, partial [Dehalococcoidia bacterium]|nr:MFS transporter [Dehalococcoidia bacterium]